RPALSVTNLRALTVSNSTSGTPRPVAASITRISAQLLAVAGAGFSFGGVSAAHTIATPTPHWLGHAARISTFNTKTNCNCDRVDIRIGSAWHSYSGAQYTSRGSTADR